MIEKTDPVSLALDLVDQGCSRNTADVLKWMKSAESLLRYVEPGETVEFTALKILANEVRRLQEIQAAAFAAARERRQKK